MQLQDCFQSVSKQAAGKKRKGTDMSEIITIGETMAAMTPKSNGYLHYIRDYELRIAGAVRNLAIGVCKLGHSAAFVSSLGDDELGYFVNNSIRAEGVDTSLVRFDAAHPTGVMFKQVLRGKETSVFYYRENSAASHMTEDMLSPTMFAGGRILHLTGITPVLSQSCRRLTEKAAEAAQEAGIKISFDPNIRRKLWKGQDYGPVLRRLAEQSHILLLGLEEAEVLFKTREQEKIAEAFFRHTQASCLAIKNGSQGAYVADRSGGHQIPPHPCEPVDPIGAGDAFNAGFLCGLLEGKSVREAGEMAAIAGALATESYGDIEGYPARDSMKRILAAKYGTEESGKVQGEIYR